MVQKMHIASYATVLQLYQGTVTCWIMKKTKT